MARSRKVSNSGNGGLQEHDGEMPDLRGQIPPIEIADKAVISPPRMLTATLTIIGIAPYVQHKFGQKAQMQMEATQRAGSQARSRKKREARDFEAGFRAAQHRSEEGWCGIPAPAFRNAMIDACRLVGFKMTHAKLSVFIEADGFDAEDGTPLVRIIGGEPEIHKAWGRNEGGTADLRWRPMWREWSAQVRVRWDGDQFGASDIFNLLARAGLQVGIGEGRPSSPKSNGLGWGLFKLPAGGLVVVDAGLQ